ncbi:nuclear transport factor 2 family protein [Enemella sp. A6]|uniref:nuclear transport factor 2 family protein n=1 Tax=Enemella sp. A6 TaxID=3440152 RepID=UPI003EC0B743
MTDFDPIAQIVEITNLVPRMAQAADFGTIEDYRALMTEDFVWDYTGGGALGAPQVITGRQAMLDGAHERREAGIQGPGTHTRHVVSTISVDPDPQRPRATSYWHFYRDTDADAALTSMGRYHDEFTRAEDGRWVFASRRIIID